MGRLFISHASQDKQRAQALARWLKANGWTDYFLYDAVEVERRINAGEQWQERLKHERRRCDALIAIVTPDWLRSTWSTGEACGMVQDGKRFFGVLVGDVELHDVPSDIRSEWQLCDLRRAVEELGPPNGDPATEPTSIFSERGLEDLRAGLHQADLDARAFPWPPPQEPRRSPYRGFKSLWSEDAAVYFGRDTEIRRGVDRVRSLRDPSQPKVLVILGASGSGKSSFLRAGLSARLRNDDKHLLVLPVLRAARSILDGEEGLAEALFHAFEQNGSPISRPAAREACRATASLEEMLEKLRSVHQKRVSPDGSPPALLFLIDQAEELHHETPAHRDTAAGRKTAADSARFLDWLAGYIRRQPGGGPSIVVMTIRTDLYAPMQSDRRFAGLVKEPFDLPPLEETRYQEVIEGPARRLRAIGKPLHIEPELTSELLNNSRGRNALPLLAFTLERLYEDFGASQKLTLEDYRTFGGIEGAIESAVGLAFANPDRLPSIPHDEAAQQALLRRALIPWLAEVDEGQEFIPRRRPSTWGDLPADTHAIVTRLVDARLLSVSSVGVSESPTIEIAHDALLQLWAPLRTWLQHEADELRLLLSVERSARVWARNGKRDEWLEHVGTRFESANALLAREHLSGRLQEHGAEYLKQCQRRDATDRQRTLREIEQAKELQASRAESQARTRKFQRRLGLMLGALTLVAGAAVAAGVYLVRAGSTQVSLIHARAAAGEIDRNNNERGLRLALLATQKSWRQAPHAAAWNELARAAYTHLPLEVIENVVGVGSFPAAGSGGATNGEALSAATDVILIRHSENSIFVRRADSDEVVATLETRNPIIHSMVLPGGREAVTVSAGQIVELWSLNGGRLENGVPVAEYVTSAANGVYEEVFASPDGTAFVVTFDNDSALIVDVQKRAPWAGIAPGALAKDVDGITFLGSGKLIRLTRTDGAEEVYHREAGRILESVVVEDIGTSGWRDDRLVAFLQQPDEKSRRLVVWDTAADREIFSPQSGRGGECDGALNLPGDRLFTHCEGESENSATVWNAIDGSRIGQIDISDAAGADPLLTRDGERIIVPLEDRSALVLDGRTGKTLGKLPVDSEELSLEPRTGLLLARTSAGAFRAFDTRSLQAVEYFLAERSETGEETETVMVTGSRSRAAGFHTPLPPPLPGGLPFTSVSWIESGGVAVVGADSMMRVWLGGERTGSIPIPVSGETHDGVYVTRSGNVLTIDDEQTARRWITGRAAGQGAFGSVKEDLTRGAPTIQYSIDAKRLIERTADRIVVSDPATGKSTSHEIRNTLVQVTSGADLMVVDDAGLWVRRLSDFAPVLGPLQCGGKAPVRLLFPSSPALIGARSATGTLCIWYRANGEEWLSSAVNPTTEAQFAPGESRLSIYQGGVLTDLDVRSDRRTMWVVPPAEPDPDWLPYKADFKATSPFGNARLFQQGKLVRVEQVGGVFSTYSLKETASIGSAFFNRSGSLVVTGGSGSIDIWHVRPEQHIQLLAGDKRNLTPLGFVGEKRFAASDGEGRLHILDAQTGAEVDSVEGANPGFSSASRFQATPDGSFFAISRSSGHIRAWCMKDLSRSLDITLPYGISDVRFAPDGKSLLFSAVYEDVPLEPQKPSAFKYLSTRPMALETAWIENPDSLRVALCTRLSRTLTRVTVQDGETQELANRVGTDLCE